MQARYYKLDGSKKKTKEMKMIVHKDSFAMIIYYWFNLGKQKIMILDNIYSVFTDYNNKYLHI